MGVIVSPCVCVTMCVCVSLCVRVIVCEIVPPPPPSPYTASSGTQSKIGPDRLSLDYCGVYILLPLGGVITHARTGHHSILWKNVSLKLIGVCGQLKKYRRSLREKTINEIFLA